MTKPKRYRKIVKYKDEEIMLTYKDFSGFIIFAVIILTLDTVVFRYPILSGVWIFISLFFLHQEVRDNREVYYEEIK